MFAIFAPSHVCLDFHVQTVMAGFKMVEKRMHLIYKGDHWVHRPTRLSKHCAASRQRLAGRSSNHIFHSHTHSCTNTHKHTHTYAHKPQVYPQQTLPVFPSEKQNKGSWGKQWTGLASLTFLFEEPFTTNIQALATFHLHITWL